MWFISRLGAFSIVRKPNDPIGWLTVRARVRDDLEALLRRCDSADVEIRADEGTDYRYRATLERELVGDVLFDEAFDIDYANFKVEVERVQGFERARVYSNVWGALLGLEEVDEETVGDACLHPHTLNGVCQYCRKVIDE